MSEKIDFKKFIQESEWRDDPTTGFEQRASLEVALWVLRLFAVV